MTIHSGEAQLTAGNRRTTIGSRAHNGITTDRRETTFEGYFIEKRAIVGTMRIGLTSADMHIPEMLTDG